MTNAEAIELASRLIRQGHIHPMDLTLDELFTPYSNIRIGTTILAEFYRLQGTADPVQSLFRALPAYRPGKGPGT